MLAFRVVNFGIVAKDLARSVRWKTIERGALFWSRGFLAFSLKVARRRGEKYGKSDNCKLIELFYWTPAYMESISASYNEFAAWKNCDCVFRSDLNCDYFLKVLFWNRSKWTAFQWIVAGLFWISALQRIWKIYGSLILTRWVWKILFNKNYVNVNRNYRPFQNHIFLKFL